MGALIGIPADRYAQQNEVPDIVARGVQFCCAPVLPGSPWRVLGLAQYWRIKRKWSKERGVDPAVLVRLFHKATKTSLTYPGAVRIRGWNKQYDGFNKQLLKRQLQRKGNAAKYLTFDSFLDLSWELCILHPAELPAYAVKLLALKQSPADATLEVLPELVTFLHGDIDTVDPSAAAILHRLQAHGTPVGLDALRDLTARYPVFIWPLLKLQRAYQRKVFGEQYWHDYHCARVPPPDDWLPEHYYLATCLQAQIMTGRMAMLEVALGRPFWYGVTTEAERAACSPIPGLARWTTRLNEFASPAARILTIHDTCRTPSRQCLICACDIKYCELQDTPKTGPPAPAEASRSPKKKRARRKKQEEPILATASTETPDAILETKVDPLDSELDNPMELPGAVTAPEATATTAAPDQEVAENHQPVGDDTAPQAEPGPDSEPGTQPAADAAMPPQALPVRVKESVEKGKSFDTGFCIPCEKIIMEWLAAQYGYKFARTVLMYATARTSPTDAENWTGKRQLQQHTLYTHVTVPLPELTTKDIKYRSSVFPDERLAELECWVRLFDDGTQRHFYYNLASGESQWKQPDKFIVTHENMRGLREQEVEVPSDDDDVSI